MKTLVFLSFCLLVSVDATAALCKPDPSCASGQTCLVDMLTGEYQCKVVDDPNEEYVTVRTCYGHEHFPLRIDLQESLLANGFDRVVVSHATTSHYFIALGFPNGIREILAASANNTLRLVPQVVNNDALLTIGDRNLGNASRYKVTCHSIPNQSLFSTPEMPR